METTTSGLHSVTLRKFIWLQRSQETIAQSFCDQSASVCITAQSGAKKSLHPNDKNTMEVSGILFVILTESNNYF